jgi:hypothetical protein
MNADISYIMSCSDAEFEKVTGVRLPDEAWQRWCNDMEERKEQLLMVVQKAIETEREACANACEEAKTNDWEGSMVCATVIRARAKA